MKFKVVTPRAAERDFNGILEYIASRSKAGAEAWASAFDKALARLEESADSCPLALENDFVDFEVRESLFKTRRGLIYRILFTIHEDTVIILHVRGPGDFRRPTMEGRYDSLPEHRQEARSRGCRVCPYHR
jgi:plasmid stabilization system protein ParE